MTSRGRPKGSKNKLRPGGWQKAKQFAFLRELPKEEQTNAVELSKLTGISLKKICGDAMAEGLAVLRTDVYAELVRFNERRGKVIHEKDLEAIAKEAVHDPYNPGLDKDQILGHLKAGLARKDGPPFGITNDEQSQSVKEAGGENVEGGTERRDDEVDTVFLGRPVEARPGDAHVGPRLRPEIIKVAGSDSEELGE